jgi:transcriptional regulator with XRE-family HTH domain
MTGTRTTDADLLTWQQARVLAAALPGLREARGWTQKRLAAEAGVPEGAAWQAEQANHRSGLDVTGKLAAVLGMTLEELAGPGPEGELTGRQRLGQEVRRLRQDRGWTQRALAAAAGLSQTVVHQAEAGKPTVTEATLAAIAGALGTTLAGLTGEQERTGTG